MKLISMEIRSEQVIVRPYADSLQAIELDALKLFSWKSLQILLQISYFTSSTFVIALTNLFCCFVNMRAWPGLYVVDVLYNCSAADLIFWLIEELAQPRLRDKAALKMVVTWQTLFNRSWM